MEKIRDFTIGLIQRLGGDESGSFQGTLGQVVLLLVVLLVLVVFVVLLLRMIFKSRSVRGDLNKKQLASLERVSGMMGRLEKLEMTLNDFKTEFMRWQEFSTIELKYLRSAIDDVKAMLEERGGPPGRGGPRGGQAGGRDPGGGGRTPQGGGAGPSRFSGREEAPQVVAKSSLLAEPAEAAPQTLRQRLAKSREGLLSKFKGVFSDKGRLDQEALDELEASLISSDLGVKTVSSLIEEIKADIDRGRTVDQKELSQLLKKKISEVLQLDAPQDSSIGPERGSKKPFVVMLVGVNGVGKTTTVAKLAQLWKESGLKVLMVAADTFRAAAVEQLSEWADKTGVSLVSGEQGAKPSTVVYEAMERAKQEDFDVVVIDTAGRLHTKSNLMQELEGVGNIVKKHQEDGPDETILVVDGSTGQNAVNQAREFHASVPLTGLIITKLDGTPKGGVLVAIKSELGIPVRYIGVGESRHDLRPFKVAEFVDALFDSPGEERSGVAVGPSRPLNKVEDETWNCGLSL